MTQQQPTPGDIAAAKEATEKAWRQFESRNPDLMTDRAAVEAAAGEWINAQREAGASREEVFDGLARGAEETLRKRLGSERMTDSLTAHQRKIWGDG